MKAGRIFIYLGHELLMVVYEGVCKNMYNRPLNNLYFKFQPFTLNLFLMQASVLVVYKDNRDIYCRVK